ncbi:hypothetical protein DFH08DRAFT_962897 [Mycena albidolilacea]|uniref:Uncharacterized protein n=1 Tax=Mycena albidolilacea TaxID=1033008 RepID=A0AAD7EP84_9AGAR|nr:hypothetical protein DFH08DRAFT_962897 [Mycena albidolilacea]
MAIDALSTITSSSHIRRINFLFSYPTRNACAQLDSTLAGLSLDHPLAVEVEIMPGRYNISPYFPQLNSRNMLRRVDREHNWIDSYIGKTGPFY